MATKPKTDNTATETHSRPYKMRIHLSVLKQLGINLYGNTPSAVAEVVANAWDADAENVWVDTAKDSIIIEDDGHGMNQDDINAKYLMVGYQRRREGQPTETPKLQRKPMGRKGIGKLSLFSIANTIEIHSQKTGHPAGAFLMETQAIEKALEKEQEGEYYPTPITPELTYRHGTRIVLRDLKINYKGTALKRALARRFSVIGQAFCVYWNKQPLSAQDRFYADKMQYIWTFGESPAFIDNLTNIGRDDVHPMPATIDSGDSGEVISGWIGTVKTPKTFRVDEIGNLNKISILVRGKMAKDDVLDELKGSQHADSYMLGEIHADFLDDDNRADIATTDRQDFSEEDQRYKDLVDFLRDSITAIRIQWGEKRAIEGPKNMMESNPVLKKWYEGLPKEVQTVAKKIIGSIHSTRLSEEDKKPYYKNAAIAVEISRHRNKLSLLADVTGDNLAVVSQIFRDIDELESAYYYEIVTGRLEVIKKLEVLVDEKQKETALQAHIFEHLWLIDPSWERAAGSERKEQSINKAFNGDKSSEYRERVDIKYRTTANKHVIIELKRAGRNLKDTDILAQLQNYLRRAQEILTQHGEISPVMEGVCVLERLPSEWDNPLWRTQGVKILEAARIRVITYDQLIENAKRAYGEFLAENEKASGIRTLVAEIDASS